MALESQFLLIVEAEPELLAYHFALAKLPDRACTYYESAWDRAASRSAYAEGVASFNASLGAAQSLSSEVERGRKELALLLKLGPALAIRKGPQSSEVVQLIAGLQSTPSLWVMRRVCIKPPGACG